MNATFVLDRSHPAKSPSQFLPKPFSPFSPESLVRCSGCAPPGRTKLKQPTAGRASFFHTVPCVSSPLWRLSVEEKRVPLYPQTAQASSAKTKPEEGINTVSFFCLVRLSHSPSEERRESAFSGNRRCNFNSRRHPLPKPFPATS